MAYKQQIGRGKSCSYKSFQQKGLIKQTYTVSESSETKKEPYLGGKPTSEMTKEELMNHPNSPTNKYKGKPESFTIYKGKGSTGRGSTGTRRVEETTYTPSGDGYTTSTNVKENPDFKEKIEIELNMPKSGGKPSGATNYSGVGVNKAPGSGQSFCTAAKGGGCLKP